MALSAKNASALLKKQGRFLYVTHGNETVYQIHGHGVVTRKAANELTCGLFDGLPMPMQRRNEPPLIPAEDGLFPGMSQTYWPSPETK